jgi:hypothetical protein
MVNESWDQAIKVPHPNQGPVHPVQKFNLL